MNMQSSEECLREAEESERLAGLARSVATQQIMTVMASKWRRLAKMAAERQSHRHPNIQPAHALASQTKRSVNRGLNRQSGHPPG
jgi:predicted ATPase